MQLWQHRARLVVATIGIATAIAVYAAMKERESVSPTAAPKRLDPTALIESSGNVVQQVRGTKQDFLIKAEQQLTYEGGSTRLLGVEISVGNRGGRDFVIRAAEALAGERQQELHLRGNVRLSSSDGFELTTAEAFFSEANGQMRAPGTFTFSRRLLAGTGTGMTYDRMNDVLSIVSSADIRLKDEGGSTRTQFLAGSAVFTRPAHLIVLSDTVHVLHNEQIADASRASAHLNEDDSLLRRIELRDNAEVNGGGEQFDRLRAMSIDLDYGDDGQRLSHVALAGEASMRSPGTSGRAGRDLRGGTIDLTMGDDGSVSDIGAREAVQLTLPASSSGPSRVIEARQLDADGAADGGLADARFEGNVVYRESRGRTAARVVRSRALRVVLDEDEIESAVFSGAVRFEEDALLASGATVTYAPVAGSLVIAGADSGGGPRVSDEQIAVDAARITVQIESRDMSATGGVRTTLRPRTAAGNAVGREGGASAAASRLPGLFERGTAANGSADTFEYSGAGGQAAYSGSATLWQAETAVRGNRITLDQVSGDLRVDGAARSSLRLASGNSVSRSAGLAYLDRERTITYQGDASGTAQLTSPDGDLRADSIKVTLAESSNSVERLDATTAVTLKLDTRTATGAQLVFHAADQQYVMTGSPRTPVTIVENCRETTGSTLTFYKSADRIVIDGNETSRTQSVSGQQCSEPRRR